MLDGNWVGRKLTFLGPYRDRPNCDKAHEHFLEETLEVSPFKSLSTRNSSPGMKEARLHEP